ncbi:MAG: hypothetical protein AB7P56_06840 [Nitrososphaeraceae archaeon]
MKFNKIDETVRNIFPLPDATNEVTINLDRNIPQFEGADKVQPIVPET